jgi:four helix bundle protein
MQSNAFSYRRLDVWQKSQAVAADVIRLIKNLPKDLDSQEIARQLVRAAGSVPANIAEGHGRYTLASYRNHLLIARGSACEVGSWLNLLQVSGYIAADDADKVCADTDSVIAILTTKARKLETDIRGRIPSAVREPTIGYAIDDLDALEAADLIA